ncbi:DNA gyrase inhibitor YacG [Peredibacter sp. HCB2-198]|uniref:DNA gyrase inhibitor YacG n=1 Tax=Peredibacter sp. HCB2-198 TaxID=3383025 RepID=UPI0038B63FBA
MKQLMVTCPTCKQKFNYYSSEFRPFCSEKCRLIDLGQWLTESYAVPVEKLTEEEIQTLEELVHEKNAEEEKKHHD